MVLQPARRADDDMRAARERAGLAAGVHAADAGHDPAAGIAIEPGQFAMHLLGADFLLPLTRLERFAIPISATIAINPTITGVLFFSGRGCLWLLRDGGWLILIRLGHDYSFPSMRWKSTLCLPMVRYPLSSCLGTV